MRSTRLLELSDFDFSNIGGGLSLTVALSQKIRVSRHGSCAVSFRLHSGSIPAGASVQLVLRQAAPSDEDPAQFFRGNVVAVAQLDASLGAAPALITAPTNLFTPYVAASLVVTQATTPAPFAVTLSADLTPRRDISPMSLNLAWGGTFARGLAAYYATQAPTDGKIPFLALAPSGVRRSADVRGDGIPASLLMEKSATNYLLHSRDMSNASWTAGTGTLTTNVAAGPDDLGLAAQQNAASGQYGAWQPSPGPTGNVVASIWAMGVSATQSHQILLLNAPAVARVVSATASAWIRNVAQGSVGVAAGMISLDARDETADGGQGATAQNCYLDLPQLERGFYPTSPITTTTGTVTRPADSLWYDVGTYPDGFLTDGFVVDFAADAASSEIASAGEDWRLVQAGSSDYLCIRNVSGTCKVELVCGGSVIASAAVTFARSQRMSITAKPSAGSVSIVITGGTNASASGPGLRWPAAKLYIGGDDSNLHNATGRYVNALIAPAF